MQTQIDTLSISDELQLHYSLICFEHYSIIHGSLEHSLEIISYISPEIEPGGTTLI